MDAGRLLGNGFIAADLPSAFSTNGLWENYSDIHSIRILEKESACSFFSAPKRGNFRRTFGVPNPMHQMKLVQKVCDHWSELENHFAKSRFSTSVPTESSAPSKAIERGAGFGDFKDKCEMEAYRFKYKLKLDINNFFPSIYTHTLGWSLHGKVNGRNNSLFGNQLDELVRNTNKKQSVGIPIGPDTSVILSEIIGVSLDIHLQNLNTDLIGFRYVDDCNFYFDTRSMAENCLEQIEIFLNDYHLSVNDSKTSISETIDATDEKWVVPISSFEISNSEKHQRDSIKRFFSLIFDFSGSNHSSSAAKFGTNKIMGLLLKREIHDANHDIVNSLLFRVCLHNPECIGGVFRFIDENQDYFDKEMIRKFCLKILKDCCHSTRNYEIIWSLWLMSRLELKIMDNNLIDSLSQNLGLQTIQIHDMSEKGLLSKIPRINISEIGSITDEHWMLAYTLQTRGWCDRDFFGQNEFFSKLRDLGVEFYQLHNTSISVLSARGY